MGATPDDAYRQIGLLMLLNEVSLHNPHIQAPPMERPTAIQADDELSPAGMRQPL